MFVELSELIQTVDLEHDLHPCTLANSQPLPSEPPAIPVLGQLCDRTKPEHDTAPTETRVVLGTALHLEPEHVTIEPDADIHILYKKLQPKPHPSMIHHCAGV